jgi:cytochrome c oxidase subunit II
MFAQVSLFPEQASTAATQVDNLFFFILGITAFVAVAIAVILIYFAIRYRRQAGGETPPRILGSNPLEITWSVVPLLIFLIFFGWGAHVYFYQMQPPDNAIEIYVVGKQWMWKIEHSGGQTEINELHVPVNQAVKLTLISEDVIHDFFVPAFRTKIDVLPGRYVHTWFQATKPGRYHLFCAQFCGTNHAGMIGSVVVMEQDEYVEWLNSRANESAAAKGRKLFLKLQCVTCHSADAQARAPVLEDIFMRQVTLQDGRTVVADEDYLYESIRKPEAKIVAGFQPIMPAFSPQDVNADEMNQLLAFLKSLRPGQTPSRTEVADPPALESRSPQGGHAP